MFKKTKERVDNSINAGSMADIAFLLLIFFLVTTTIVADKGIMVKLPPWSDIPPPPSQTSSRNLLAIKVNKNNDLLIEGKLARLEEVKGLTKEFVLNPENRDDLARSPQKAVVSFQNDRETSYKMYIEVYNEIIAAYNEMKDDLAMQNYGRHYTDCKLEQQKRIRTEIPQIISEAEPTTFGLANK